MRRHSRVIYHTARLQDNIKVVDTRSKASGSTRGNNKSAERGDDIRCPASAVCLAGRFVLNSAFAGAKYLLPAALSDVELIAKIMDRDSTRC
jgi:hypothetical protein